MSRKGSRFSPSRWSQCFVPALLILLLLALLVTIIVVILSLLGLTPGF